MSNIVISGDTSGSSTLQAPAVAGGSVLTLPVATDTLVGKATTDVLTNKTLTSPVIDGTPTGVGVLTTGTFVNASGTAVTFTGIPSWVKRITIMLVGLSTASTGVPTIRIGTSSGVENTGYGNTIAVVAASTVVGQVSATSGWELITNGGAANAYYGNIVLTNFGTANFWNVTGSICAPNATYTITVAGNKALVGTLTQLQITTTGGTDTFDAGSINIMYE